MYYLHARGRNAHPSPAEAPYTCSPNALHEWEYGQEKHKAALKNVKGAIDMRVPSSIDPVMQRVQEKSRRFAEDQRKAEIGRENRKLVERLHFISRGLEGADPRSPPPSSLSGAQQAHASASGERGRSLEAQRRRARRLLDEDNAALVRRILQARGTFDRAGDERDFQRHQRDSYMLQRMPNAPMKTRSQPRLLPPLRPPRAMSTPLLLPARGLDMLLLPGDLRRSESGRDGLATQPQQLALGDGASGSSTPAASPPSGQSPASRPWASPAAAASSPHSAHPESAASTPAAAHRQNSLAASSSPLAAGPAESQSSTPAGHIGTPARPSQGSPPRPAFFSGPEEAAGNGDVDEDADDGGDLVGHLPPSSGMAQTGMSTMSEQQYSEDSWDQDSAASRSQSPSRSGRSP